MSNIKTTIESLKDDAAQLVLACVDYNIKYDDFEYDKASSPMTIKEELFRFIIKNNPNVYRIFRLIGWILFTTYDLKRDYFKANGILNHDQLLDKFINDVMYHPEIQDFLDVQYNIHYER
jgi:hypothetical protein